MSSSENFDEFMRRLGVGMVKRKMANSVTPVNVVEMEPDGETLLFFTEHAAIDGGAQPFFALCRATYPALPIA